MMRLVALLPIVSACAINTSSPTDLVSIATPTVSLATYNDPTGVLPQIPSALFAVSISDDDCVRIGDDVTATLDGVPLAATSRGGWTDTGTDGTCTAARFALVDPAPTSASHLELHDSTATWTIDAAALFANDFEIHPMPGAAMRVTWSSATAIALADADLTDANGATLWSSVDVTKPRAVVAIVGEGFEISAPIPTMLRAMQR